MIKTPLSMETARAYYNQQRQAGPVKLSAFTVPPNDAFDLATGLQVVLCFTPSAGPLYSTWGYLPTLAAAEEMARSLSHV